MASQRAIVSRNGFNSQILNADTLLVGAGVDAPVAQALAVGAVNGNALNLSKVGTLTTVLGNFQVNGTSVFTGASTFNGTTTFNGLVIQPGSSFATTAALNAFGGGPAALQAAGYPDGSEVFVASQRTFYIFNSATPAWDRGNEVDTQFWLAQTAYHISDAGLPDNTGLIAGSPITPAELFLRLGSSPIFTTAGTVTINLHGTTLTSDVIGSLGWVSTNQIIVIGDVIPVGAANALSAVTPRSQATGQTLRITAPAQTYTPGNYVQITASVNPTSVGAMMPIMADLGGGVAEVGPAFFYNAATQSSSGTEVVPVAGDAIQHVNFTNCTGSFTLRFIGATGAAAGVCKGVVRKLRLTGTGVTKFPTVSNGGMGIMVITEVIQAATIFRLYGATSWINDAVLAGAGLSGPADSLALQGGINQNLTGFVPTSVGSISFSGGWLTIGPLFCFHQTMIVSAIQMSSQATAGRVLLAIDRGGTVMAFAAACISFNVVAGGIIIAEARIGKFVNYSLGTWASTIVTNATEAALPFKIGAQTGVNTFTVATGVWSAGAVAMTIASLDAAFAGKAEDPRSSSGIFRQDLA